MPQATLVKDIQLFHLLCIVMNYNYRPQCVQLSVQITTVIHMRQTRIIRAKGAGGGGGGSKKRKEHFKGGKKGKQI